jgi:ComF family protein
LSGSSLVSSLLSGANGVAAALFTTLFPSDCRLCAEPLTNVSRLPVCLECLSAIRPIDGELCAICGERLPAALAAVSDETLCGLCRHAAPPYVKATAYGSYEGGLRELIHLLKYDRVRPAANVLGRMLAEAIEDLQPLFGDNEILVVPVPLFVSKNRQRGFNQAELIARAAVKLMSVRFHLAPGLLKRRRETQSQIGLSRHQRRENLRGAFVLTKPEEIAGRQVLLIDDVMTTGTTVSECARVLRRAGASKVYVATVARTLKAELQGVRIEPESEAAAMTMAAAG